MSSDFAPSPRHVVRRETLPPGTEPLSLAIGDFVSNLNISSLSAGDLSTLKFALMDCLGSAIAGAREHSTEVALNLVGTHGGKDDRATILAHSARSSPLVAAFANGTMAHACDLDDVSETMCGHPTAPALPAILAAAEFRARSGSEVLVALAAAIEVMTKLGRAVGYELLTSGWHPTATLGVFGAAAGAAKILGLDAERTATAIGIAASRAAGLNIASGTTVKPLHCGFAARDGLEAALLAAAGATASPRALEGTTGFLDTFVPNRDRATDIVALLGKPFDTREPGIAFKKYASCWDTHSGIDAILELRDTHGLEPEHVTSIRYSLAPGMGSALTYHDPSTPLQGKFSMEFCGAVALARGRVSQAEFGQHTLADLDIRRLISASALAFDPTLASANRKSFCAAARVDMELNDGRIVSTTVTHMRGHPQKPMTAQEFEDKFRECAEPVFGNKRVDRTLTMLHRFDQLADTRLLMTSLRA